MNSKIAVLVPCFNEAATVGQVVADFAKALPAADIYVYDNNSNDGTASLARAAGAIVRQESHQGKGHVVRRMFADINADVFVLVDGDATYDATSAPLMVARLRDEYLDMIVGKRTHVDSAAYRSGHEFGNRLLTSFISFVFGRAFSDILSGYRVMSRRFVKSFPVLSDGFEIETELTVHALELALPTSEVDTAYGTRPVGSASKLSTYKDGCRILRTIIRLYRSERPFIFFSVIGMIFAAVSAALGLPVIETFLETGFVPKLPTAVLAMGLMIMAVLMGSVGLILDTVTRGRREAKLLAFLAQGPR